MSIALLCALIIPLVGFICVLSGEYRRHGRQLGMERVPKFLDRKWEELEVEYPALAHSKTYGPEYRKKHQLAAVHYLKEWEHAWPFMLKAEKKTRTIDLVRKVDPWQIEQDRIKREKYIARLEADKRKYELEQRRYH